MFGTSIFLFLFFRWYHKLPTHELPTGRQFRGRQFVMHHSTGLPTLIMKSYFDIQKCCCLLYFFNLYLTVPNFWERVKNLEKTMEIALFNWNSVYFNYNSDNWEPEFMKSLFNTWQFRVTLDSICNYCNVFATRSRPASNQIKSSQWTDYQSVFAISVPSLF